MYKQLTSEQRYAIGLMLKQNCSQKIIAEMLNVHPSTICREIKRNKGKRGHYNSEYAQECTNERRFRLPGNKSLPWDVKKKAISYLETEQWSPKQISGYLSLSGIKISYETIYKIIREDKINGGTLYKNCRHELKHRKRCKWLSNKIPDRISIKERPPEANGLRFGDWEMDTIVGKGNVGAIVTLTERSTNFLLMHKLPYGKNAKELSKVVCRMLLPYKDYVHTITTDNGSEFTNHKEIARLLDTKVFFADPYSSWQKGSIENANKIIRQYIPKGKSFVSLSDESIYKIQIKINRRPREKLNFLSPKQVFFKNLL